MELKEALKTLAKERQALQLERDLLTEAEADLHKTSEYHFWLIRKGAADLAIEDLRDAEYAARTAAVEAYLATQSKNPAPGVQIKLYHQIHYDPMELLTWCKSNAP